MTAGPSEEDPRRARIRAVTRDFFKARRVGQPIEWRDLDEYFHRLREAACEDSSERKQLRDAAPAQITPAPIYQRSTWLLEMFDQGSGPINFPTGARHAVWLLQSKDAFYWRCSCGANRGNAARELDVAMLEDARRHFEELQFDASPIEHGTSIWNDRARGEPAPSRAQLEELMQAMKSTQEKPPIVLPTRAYPLTIRIYSGTTNALLWSREVSLAEARGLAQLQVPGYAGTPHYPVRIEITYADGTVDIAGRT